MLLTEQKISSAEQRQRREDRIACIRLRMAIGHELDERGIIAPAAIGAACRRSRRSSC